MNDEPTTVLDALRVLAADGFDTSFALIDGSVHDEACRTAHPIEQITALRVYRFEGPSDPDEEAAVYAVQCQHCGARGAIVTSYGPGADPALTDRLDVPRAHARDR